MVIINVVITIQLMTNYTITNSQHQRVRGEIFAMPRRNPSRGPALKLHVLLSYVVKNESCMSFYKLHSILHTSMAWNTHETEPCRARRVNLTQVLFWNWTQGVLNSIKSRIRQAGINFTGFSVTVTVAHTTPHHPSADTRLKWETT